ncbi:MAG: tetratricopeptide repeat protein [Nitrospirota bacterium]|nr:tetratricopeptide repeat protein [Nitrospirota bacterium]
MTALALMALFIASLTTAALLRNRIYETGLSVWKSMVESSPDKRRPHENYGQALSTAGRLQEALQEFKTVLSLPDDGSVPLRDVYREIGVVYFRLGLFDESITAWKTGLVHAPLDAGLLNNIAIALLKQQRYDEAVSHAETAVRANNTMPEPVNTLGEIYLAKGEFARAAEFFKRYIYLRPEDPRGSWNVAIALARGGRYEEAYQHVNRFLASELDPRERAGATDLLNFINESMNKKRH